MQLRRLGHSSQISSYAALPISLCIMHDFTSRKTTEPDPAASYNTYRTDFVAAMAMMHQDVSMIDVGSLNTAPSNVALSVVSLHFCLS